MTSNLATQLRHIADLNEAALADLRDPDEVALALEACGATEPCS